MVLTVSLQNQVDELLRERGTAYFERGAVRLLVGTARHVVAQVLGTRPYRVVLRVPDDPAFLRTHCTCPYFEDYGICKHVWATLLLAEQRELLTSLEIADQPVLVEEDEWPDQDTIESHGEQDRSQGDAWSAALDDDSPADWPIVSQHRVLAGGRDRSPAPRGLSWLEDLTRLQVASANRRTTRQRTHGAMPERTDATASSSTEQLIYLLDLRPTMLEASGLVLSLWTRRSTASGSWGKPKPTRVQRQTIDRWGRADRRVLALVLGSTADSEYSLSPVYGDTAFRLQSASLPTLLPLLAATERLFARREDSDDLGALTFDDGPDWQFVVRVVEGPEHWLIEGLLRRQSEQMTLEDPELITRDGWLLVDGRLALLSNPEPFDWLALLRQRRAIEVPRCDGDALLTALFATNDLPPLELPAPLKVEQIELAPRPYLRVFRPERRPGSRHESLTLDVRFSYGDTDVPADSDVTQLLQPGQRRLIIRDHASEQAALQRLRQLGCRPLPRYLAHNEHGPSTLCLAARKLPPLVQVLLAEGWRIEADGHLYRRAGPLSINVQSGVDWFDLAGQAEFEGQMVPLPRILAAIRRGESEIVLDDGSVGILPEQWLARYGLLVASAELSDESVRFRSSQATLLDALLEAREEVHWDRRAEQARHVLHEFSHIEALDPPKTFLGQLRPYQREGLGWFAFLRRYQLGGCLADDMGLGKTVQALALLDQRRRKSGGRSSRDHKPSLVVAPRSVLFNWYEETRRFAPRLRVLEHVGGARAKQADVLAGCDLALTSYGVLRRDIGLLSKVSFDYVILDEAQAIKNLGSQSAKSARLLRADHRLALSGTPIENHVGELWSLFEFLNPGMLGSAAAFRSLGNHGDPLESSAKSVLTRAIRPLILRRTKQHVAEDLPAKTEQTIYCELTGEQRRRYDEIRDHYRTSLLQRLDTVSLQRSKLQVLEALLRLRQAACHPGLIDRQLADLPSAKIDLLIERLEQLFEEGHKALIFSQFTQLLALVRQQLDQRHWRYEYLDGRTRKRGDRVARFQQDPECRLFLISLKAGGLGLNLTAADYVFLLDPWWNPAVEAQAIDRAHRIGQTEHVFAYRLIARDTVEEKVIELQQHKRKLADALISGDSRPLRDLTRQDVELLFS